MMRKRYYRERCIHGIFYCDITERLINIHINIDSDLKSLTQKIIKKFVDENHNLKSFGRITPKLDEVYLKYVKGN